MSKLVVELTDEKFKNVVESSDTPVMVDFWASWCGPCRIIAPIVDEVAEEFKNRLIVAKINIDENQVVASQLGIMNIPTIVFFKDGKEVSRFSGVVSKTELTRRIESVIGE